MHCQPPGQRYLQNPEAEEIDIGRCDCIAGAVECLQKHHAVGVSDVPAAKDPQTTDGSGDYFRIMREELDDPRREDNKDDSYGAEEGHIPKAGSPHGITSAIRALCSKILSHQGCSSVA